MSNWTEVSNVQQDNCERNGDYTTYFMETTTLRYTHGHQTLIVRIKFKNDTGRSSSYDDASIDLLTKDGWKFIASDIHIPLEWSKINNGFQANCRINSLHDTSKIWHEACKKYIEEIATVL